MASGIRSISKNKTKKSRSPSPMKSVISSIRKLSPRTKFTMKSFPGKIDQINEHLRQIDEILEEIDAMKPENLTKQIEKQRNDLINSKIKVITGLSKMTEQYTRKLKDKLSRRNYGSTKGGTKKKTQKKKKNLKINL